MRTLAVFLVLACSCSRSADKPEDKAERALSEYRALRDRMCACTTADCRHDVDQALTAWDKTESGRILSQTPKGVITEEQTKQIDPIEHELKRCRH